MQRDLSQCAVTAGGAARPSLLTAACEPSATAADSFPMALSTVRVLLTRLLLVRPLLSQAASAWFQTPLPPSEHAGCWVPRPLSAAQVPRLAAEALHSNDTSFTCQQASLASESRVCTLPAAVVKILRSRTGLC